MYNLVEAKFQRVYARMSEGEDKTSSAVKELEVKKKEEVENYYVRLATNMVTTAKETRLVEDDTQDTFLKGEQQCNTRNSLLSLISMSGALGVALAFLFLGQGGHLIRQEIILNQCGVQNVEILLRDIEKICIYESW